jgi:hydrogenase maturation factor
MLPEIYFLRYAFPCARVLVDFRKTLSEEEYELMRDAVEHDRPMPRKYLEEKFSKAIQGLRQLSEDYWNVKTIREYFCEGHEAMLSADLPPLVKRLCVVKPGVLGEKIEKDGEVFFHVDLGGGDVRVVAPLYKGAATGDTAMIHYGYAVEKVDEKVD